MSSKRDLEERLIKYIYGECAPDEARAVEELICENEDCREYIQKLAGLFHLIRTAGKSGEEEINWTDVKERFNQCASMVTEATHGDAGEPKSRRET